MVAAYQWVDQDEGQYVQSALAVSHGSIPLVTFASGSEPVVLVLMAPVVMAFGPSVLVGRLFEVFFNVLTAGVIALLARRLCSSRGDIAALASASVYLFIPLVAQQNTLVLEDQIAAFFVVTSLFYLLRERWSASRWNYPVSGVLLGIAILSRRSALAVGVVWLVWILYTEGTWRSRILTSLRCFIPGIAVSAGYFLYVAKETSLQWSIAAFSTVSLPYGQVSVSLAGRIEILGYLMLMAAPLFLAPFALLVNVLRGKGMMEWASVATMLTVAGGSVLMAVYSFEVNWGIGETVAPNLIWVVVVTFALFFVLMIRENITSSPTVPAEAAVLLILAGWAVAIMALDFLPRPEAFVSYSSDAFAPLSLLFGVWFVTLIPQAAEKPHEEAIVPSVRRRSANALRRYGVSAVVVALLVISSSFVSVLVLGPSNPENIPGATNLVPEQGILTPISEIQDVGSYLKDTMRSNDSIFTFDTAFADQAGRVISPNIAQRLDQYDHLIGNGQNVNATQFPSAPPGFLPPLLGLLSYWNSTNLTWIVDGPYTQRVAASCPLFNWYLSTEYYPVTSYGDPLSYDVVEILHRGQPPLPAASEVAYTPTPSTPVDADIFNGTMYVASLNSPFVTYLGPNGLNGTIPIRFPGAKSLRIIDNDLWVGSTTTNQVEMIPLEGGATESINVGVGVSTIVADNATNQVFVSTYPTGTITALGALSNDTWWSPQWTASARGPVSDLAVNSSSGTLYAAMPSNYSIMELNVSNGHVLARQTMIFQPYALAYADGGLVATWWAGSVYRLSIASGTAIRIAGSTFLGFGLPEIISVPALNAVAIPSENASRIAFYSAESLLPLGTFQSIPCPNAVVYDASLNYMGVTSTCKEQAQWWSLPQYDQLTITGAPGTAIVVNKNVLTTYPLPMILQMWPQIISISATKPGFLPGIVEAVLPTTNSSMDTSISGAASGIAVTIQASAGPSLSSIQNLQTTFTWQIVILSVVAWIGGMALVVYPEQAGRKNNP
jgi:hypothetical protein